MSKITFRADDDLIRRLEAFDASKSEVLREALREYLDRHGDDASRSSAPDPSRDSIDELLTERVDALVAERLGSPRRTQDLNVNITLDGSKLPNTADSVSAVNVESDASHGASNDASHTAPTSKTEPGGDENTEMTECKTCTQCGETLSPSHVYCPNCGEKSSHRVFCDCGDELRSDWSFCPGCGRRTPAADVLDGA